jgi:PAS domain S-box-containing protein
VNDPLEKLAAEIEAQITRADYTTPLTVPGEPLPGRIASGYNRAVGGLKRALDAAESIIKNIGAGIITFNEDGRVTSFNPGAEQLFGGAGVDFLYEPVTQLFAADSSGAALPLEQLLTWGTRPEGATLWARRNDLSRFPVDIRLSRAQHGGQTAYTLLVKDITERKRAEDALRASRASTQRHIQSLASLAALHHQHGDDPEALVSAISYAALDTLHIQSVAVWKQLPASPTYTSFATTTSTPPKEEDEYQPPLVMRDDSELSSLLRLERVVPLGDVMGDLRIQDIYMRYLAPRKIRAFLAAQLRIGGQPWGVVFFEHTLGKREWTAEELVYAGSVADFIAMALEATERRRAEDEVRLINEELERRVEQRTMELRRSNTELHDALDRIERTQNHLVTVEKMAALGELVAGMAHEINTPVGVAVTGASFLQEQTRRMVELFESGQMKRSDLDAYMKLANESSRMLMANLQRAAELVQSFKLVAVDQSSEDRRTFAVVPYAREVLLSLRPKIKKTRQNVTVEGPDDLEIESYPGLFSQIITNLVVNSLMHAYEPQDPGHIQIIFALRDGQLEFLYKDDGKGIPEEIITRIFDPFFTTRRGRGGSGLGLHILYNIVSGRLGGSIHCESHPGQGTTFHMILPVVAQQETRP